MNYFKEYVKLTVFFLIFGILEIYFIKRLIMIENNLFKLLIVMFEL